MQSTKSLTKLAVNEELELQKMRRIQGKYIFNFTILHQFLHYFELRREGNKCRPGANKRRANF